MKHSAKVFLLLVTCYFLTSFSQEKIDLDNIDNPKVISNPITRRAQQVFTPTLTAAFFESPIGATDLDQTSSTAMLSIDNPGHFYISSDMQLNPSFSGSTVIKINVSNVMLNLNSRVISQKSTSTTFNHIAIELASGISNISIFNGMVNLFSGNAIKINSGCSNVIMNNLRINACKKNGIDIASSNNIDIREISITNCDGSDSTATSAIALNLSSCKNIFAENCFFNNNEATTAKDATGVFLTSCIDCFFKNCEASTNKGGGGAGGDAYGFRLESTTKTCVFESCEAKSNQVTIATKNVYGFYISSSNDNEFIECLASNNNSTVATASNTIAAGFYLSGSNFNYLFKCEARNQDTSSASGASANAYGFFSTNGLANRFEQSISTGNLCGNNSSAIGAGFNLEGTEARSSIIRCSTISNGGNPSNTNGKGYGIRLGGANTAFSYLIGNLILNNIGITTSQGFGIKDENPTNSTALLMQNTAFNNISQTGTNTFGSVNSEDANSGNYKIIYSGGARLAFESQRIDNANSNFSAETTFNNREIFTN